jgi:hypothetical protein
VHFDFPSSQPFLVTTQEVHLQLRSRPGSRATRGSDEVPVLFHAETMVAGTGVAKTDTRLHGNACSALARQPRVGPLVLGPA